MDIHVKAVDWKSDRIRLWEIRTVEGDRLIGTISLPYGRQKFTVESDVGDFVSDSFYEARDEVQKRLDSVQMN